MSWAAGSWHVVEAKAFVYGVTGRAGGPRSPLDLEGRQLLALVEGVLREADHHSEALDKLYAKHVSRRAKQAVNRDDRNRRIEQLARAFGG